MNRSTLRHRLGLAASFIAGQALMLWVLLIPIVDQRWWSGFRGYFANDQLSYAAIAVNASKGNLAAVEPLTETGTSHYPSLWYLMVGLLSGFTNQPVSLIWTIAGLLTIGATIGFLGFLAYRFSGFAFAPLLPALALLTGTFAVVTSQWWYSDMGYHAVIWGPFGTLFTLNAEAVGLMGALMAVGLLLHAAAFPRLRTQAIAAAALILGLLANVQTYAFLTAVSVAVAFTATFAALRFPSRQRTLATVGSLAIVLLLGTQIAQILGPLPLFVLLLASTIPIVIPIIMRYRTPCALAVGIFAVAASPQVVRTLIGLVSGDDFLTYRQASTQDLGVDPSVALVAAIPTLAIVAFNGIVLLSDRGQRTARLPRVFIALFLALGIGTLIMASNDRWGFDQEPYRFWLQYLFITMFFAAVIAAWSMRHIRDLTPVMRSASIVVGIVAVITWSISVADVREFRHYASQQGLIATADDRSEALRALIPGNNGLVLSSTCLDPQILKLITGAPVAFFNRGLAWPENRVALDTFLDPQRPRAISVEELNAAGITYVLTDAGCADEWQLSDARMQPVALQSYPRGTFTLWQVQTARPLPEA